MGLHHFIRQNNIEDVEFEQKDRENVVLHGQQYVTSDVNDDENVGVEEETEVGTVMIKPGFKKIFSPKKSFKAL